jgi:hypothetical protein
MCVVGVVIVLLSAEGGVGRSGWRRSGFVDSGASAVVHLEAVVAKRVLTRQKTAHLYSTPNIAAYSSKCKIPSSIIS